MNDFSPNIPNNNLLPISEARLKEIVNNIPSLKRLNDANKSLYSLETNIKSLPNPKILLDFISIPESVDSNKVENIYTTVGSAFQAEDMNLYATVSDTNKQILNYKEALLYWYNRIKDRWWITVEDIKKINSILIWYESNFVSSPDKKITTSTWKVVYTPPQWIDLINSLMDNFCKHFNMKELIIDGEEEDILFLAPILHYQFEAIHPFWDGNGRVWRILLVLFLFARGILSFPVLFLSQYIEKYKQDYYQCLRDIDRGKQNSLEEFTEFIFLICETQGHHTSWKVSNIRILQLQTKLKLKEEWIKISNEIMDFLFSRPYYSIESFSKTLKIRSRNTASKYLSSLVKIWLLKEVKLGKRKLFLYEKYLDLLNN